MENKNPRPLVCLCLTGRTLAEDLQIAERYKNQIDLVELRVDWLEEDERLNVREFPTMVGIPCILTIRRRADGGLFDEGEASRTQLFARALAFADEDKSRNFAYVDFEEDFSVPSLQDAALAFGTRVIRSFHDMEKPVANIVEKLNSMRLTGFEIPKIAFMPHSLSDVTDVFRISEKLRDTEQIICAMGSYGFPTRVLAQKFHSYLSFTTPKELSGNMEEIGHCDPNTLNGLYRFRSLNQETRIFGITGFPLKATKSPQIHNTKFEEKGMNAVYVPFKSETADEAFDFAAELGILGFSVTVPHKESIIDFLDVCDEKVREIGACNTVINDGGIWKGYNSDCTGFSAALLDFVGEKSIKGKKVSVIGAGGASRAVVYALKLLGAKVCVFNRTSTKARKLAEKFGFDYSGLGTESAQKIQKYSDIIVQTTSKGMNSNGEPNNDPLWFYDFRGTEMLYDIVYEPAITPIMKRAIEAGCRVSNGLSMLQAQGEEQSRLFCEVYEKSVAR